VISATTAFIRQSAAMNSVPPAVQGRQAGPARVVVQEQGQGIDAHHLMEQGGQLVEERGQITVRDGRLGNGQQGSVGIVSGSCLSVEVSAGHGETPG
jgi:hypothetical protein